MAVPFECKGMRDYLIRNTCFEIESEVGDLSKLSSTNEQIDNAPLVAMQNKGC